VFVANGFIIRSVSSASLLIRVSKFFLVAGFLGCFLLLGGCDRGSKPELVGSVAPDFTVSDAQRTVTLHDYKGRVVVLNFWATWCAPCIEELPSLIQMQHELGDRVTVLAVATDQDPDAYQRFVRDHHVDLITVDDTAEKSNAKYGTWGWPETYIIDRKGIVRRKFIGPVEWTSPTIVSYLEKLRTES
jgi:thiol-disulfide isomerase/thioredoxin